MNLADALRKVNGDPTTMQGAPAAQPFESSPTPKVESPKTESSSQQDIASPHAAHPHVGTGNVVRLELFLSAEQMGGLFRAIMAGQHSVLTAREAASYLRISRETLMKLADEGEIPGVVIDGRWRFPKSNLDDWMMIHRTGEDNEDAA